MSFNAFDFMYLNPELSVEFNIQTIEAATVFNSNNPTLPLARHLGIIPANFDPEVFFSSSRDIANVASLSRVIATSMSNQGLTSAQIGRKQEYVPSIYQKVVYLGSNIFRLENSNTVAFGSNNLLDGDTVRIIDEYSSYHTIQVGTVTPSNFTMSNSIALVYPSSNYMLYGILATDPVRIAKINYVRLIAGLSNIEAGGIITSPTQGGVAPIYLSSNIDGDFDAELYKTLYPDARTLTDTESYIDWVNKRKNEVYRIRNVYDIAYGGGNLYTDINFLRINSNLDFRGVFIDGIHTYLNPSSCNQPGDCNKLITENAIKNYTDIRVANLQNQGSFANIIINDSIVINQQATLSNVLYVMGLSYFNSNATFSNDVLIQGSASVKSNLDVTGPTVMRNSMMLTGGNATFSNNVIINGSMSVTGNVYNPRIGLGYMPGFLTSNTGLNIVQAQNYNDNSDLRIKKHVVGVHTGRCLDIIKQIKVKEYHYNYGKACDDVPCMGFIAQDIEAIDKRFVYETEGYLPDVDAMGEITGDRLFVDADLREGKLKVIVEANDLYLRVIRKLERGVYEISPAFYNSRRVCHVYGYHTNALKNVNYKELFVVAVGAIQELLACAAL
jgi:hypothetical protein